MRIIFATALFLGLLGSLVASSEECPGISGWRNATMTPGGSLVCAKLYASRHCSGFPMLLGVNSSVSNLPHTLELMDIDKADEVTVLIRPMCHVTFWSDASFKTVRDASSGYLWSSRIDGSLGATCDCNTNNVELLSCEPEEELIQIQECNYLNSSVGGICPYAIDTRHFKRNDGSDASGGRVRYLSPDETTMLNSLVGPSASSAMDVPLHVLGGEDTEKYLMYAPVKAHQSVRISQRSIHCGSYTMRTTELKFDYEIAQPNTWVLNPAAGRLYYFSRVSEQETRENAATKCEDLGGRLAILDRPEEVEFAARLVLKNFVNDTTSWWTAAAATSKSLGARWLRWEGGRVMVDGIGWGAGSEDFGCVLAQLCWPCAPVKRFFMAHCERELPFVCEKYPEL